MFPSVFPRWLLIALLAALGLAGAGAWVWHAARSSDPVSEGDALASFRAGGEAAAPARPGVPLGGVYTYRQEGSERAGAGPLAVTRDLPAQARYVARPTARGYEETLSLSDAHIEGIRFRVGEEGTRAVYRRTDITVIGIGRDDRRDLRPPPLHLPRRLEVGRTWSGRYTAGELPVTYRSEVLRREAVEVAGQRLPAFVVRTVGDTGGAHPGRRVDTFWWSPRLGLRLRWTIDMEVEGVATLDAVTDLRLVSAEPLT